MGAWIEITRSRETTELTGVAPFMGAWIEILKPLVQCHKAQSRTLYGCVDWNFWAYWDSLAILKSHPLWVRGLKSQTLSFLLTFLASHPLWVRGLKFLWALQTFAMQSRRTLYGCVDWNIIEIFKNILSRCRTLYGCVDWNYYSCLMGFWVGMSHPLWVRGLKLWSPLMVGYPLPCRTLYGCVDWNLYIRMLLNILC